MQVDVNVPETAALELDALASGAAATTALVDAGRTTHAAEDTADDHASDSGYDHGRADSRIGRHDRSQPLRVSVDDRRIGAFVDTSASATQRTTRVRRRVERPPRHADPQGNDVRRVVSPLTLTDKQIHDLSPGADLDLAT